MLYEVITITKCVIAISFEAPCQCFISSGHQTTSSGLIIVFLLSQVCVYPTPETTIICWPLGCVCQFDLAPGSKVTYAPECVFVSLFGYIGSILTSPPVKYFLYPVLLTSIDFLSSIFVTVWSFFTSAACACVNITTAVRNNFV